MCRLMSKSPQRRTPNASSKGNESQEKRQKLDFLDKYLALWVLLAMTGGILIGYFIPSANIVLDKGKFAGVSGPIAVLLLLMMYPILLNVSFESLPVVFRQSNLWKDVLLNIFVNWLISPLVMFGLAWATLPDAPALREGVILVGIARCIAMVLIWVKLAQRDTVLGSPLVALNALIQIILVAPLSIVFWRFFAGVTRPGLLLLEKYTAQLPAASPFSSAFHSLSRQSPG